MNGHMPTERGGGGRGGGGDSGSSVPGDDPLTTQLHPNLTHLRPTPHLAYALPARSGCGLEEGLLAWWLESPL